MRFAQAVDLYLAEQRRLGRINSDRTEVAYRSRLKLHGQDVDGRDPAKVGREDVKRTLARWAHPNTQRHAHAVLTSFYDWATEEGLRQTNPARQVRRAKKRPTSVYRLTKEEVVRMLDASMPVRRDRWVTHLGFCAGLRNQELRGLRARHLGRPGFVHVSPDIAKGARERWVPVIPELADVVEEILVALEPQHHIVPARRPANPPLNTRWTERPAQPSSAQAIWRLVGDVAIRAGIAEHVHPHLMRHAFGDHLARYAGLRAAKELLGHVSIDTTESTYVERPTPDELQVSVHGFSYRGLSPQTGPASPLKATTGIEPVDCTRDRPERDSRGPDQGGR